MSRSGSGRRHRALMKKIKTGIWAVIGVTAGICIIVSAAGSGKGSSDVVADTVQSEEQAAQTAQTDEAVKETTAAPEKKKIDMKEMTEGRVVIKQNILTESPNYGYTGELDVKGLMIHSIGVCQTSAEKQAKVFGDADYWEAGIHAFIDSNTGVVLHTLPWTQVAWHCGYETGNGSYIGVEMCETDAGEYTDDYKLVIEDEEKAKEQCRNTYYSAVKLFAELCTRFNLDPLEEGVVISHSEGCALGIATNHGDPESYWDAVGSGYTMDGFRKDISEYMKLIEDEGWELNENVLK